MAVSRQKKEETIAALSDLLVSSKMTVFAHYEGLDVAGAQKLRRDARADGTVIKVVKNRLFRVALSKNDTFKDMDTSALTGQLLYAFNAEDEAIPAKTLAEFAKSNPGLNLKGAFNASGELFDESQVKQLATLPSKDELRGHLVGTINAPVSGFVNVLAGNLRGLVQVLNARTQEMN